VSSRSIQTHSAPLTLFAALSLLWTWPLLRHFNDHIPGLGGDNYSFLWNLWWMRKALSAADLDFFHSRYLFSPFGVDLVNHPHTALQGYLSATVLANLSVIQAENLYIIASIFLNAACAYALAYDLTRERGPAVVAGVAFGGSPYIAAQLLGHFDLLTAWVIPLFALCLRRAIRGGRIGPAIGCGLCVAVAAYAAYYHVVYLAVLALTYAIASFDVAQLTVERRLDRPALFTTRLVLIGLMTLLVFMIVVIVTTGGGAFFIFDVGISVRGVQNPLLALWILVAVWLFTKWRVAIRLTKPPGETFWRVAQTLMITLATFTIACLPLIVQAFRLAMSGRYVSQTYFWRSAPRGIDALAPVLGNPFHPVYGSVTSAIYERLGLDRIEAVGWLGIVPVVVLVLGRGKWSDASEARRWKTVLVVFAVWALGPFLTVAGFDAGLPLPQSLARFIPLVENARMPGRAIVCVYLALGTLMALRLGALAGSASRAFRPAHVWAVAALLALDYLHAPIPLTALDRPAVYEQLAAIPDNGAVIEVPFGIGDGLSVGQGSQDRRLLYHATIHGHPVVGGYIGRMPPNVAEAYESMPVVGNLLRLSSDEDAIDADAPPSLPFRYLVLDTRRASVPLIEYVREALDMDLIAEAGGKQLYAVQGAKPGSLRARR